MNKLFTVLLILLLVSWATPSFAAVALEKDGTYKGEAVTINVESNISEDADVEITGDYSTKTLTIPLATETIACGINSGGVTAMVSNVLAVPVNYRFAYKFIGVGAEALTLANGKVGQLLTIIISTGEGGTATLTPATCTGFTSIELNATNDCVTLLYMDDIYGWVLVGGNSIAVN